MLVIYLVKLSMVGLSRRLGCMGFTATWSCGFRTGLLVEDGVVVEGHYSVWRSVTSGVLPESVLGSLFVIIYK